jgi:hypothetical protein
MKHGLNFRGDAMCVSTICLCERCDVDSDPELLGRRRKEFALPHHIPLGTLRDWEQGRCEPDQPSRAWLTVIAHELEG